VIVHLTAEAEADIESIGDFIARENPQRALTYVRELRKTCLSLGDAPLAFPLVPRYEAHGVRRRVHGNYLIFYRTETGRVVVIHVLHGARNYADILFANEV
jgi:toxin ParE1/3/4|tara:strand:- start:15715 stop:16017 length:303 start_codon:yes stop_codon:yes gene_type:complete